MGADCLISGIRPQIAQTIIHLGVDLSDVTTKATLADAFARGIAASGHKVVRQEAARRHAATDRRGTNTNSKDGRVFCSSPFKWICMIASP